MKSLKKILLIIIVVVLATIAVIAFVKYEITSTIMSIIGGKAMRPESSSTITETSRDKVWKSENVISRISSLSIRDLEIFWSDITSGRLFDRTPRVRIDIPKEIYDQFGKLKIKAQPAAKPEPEAKSETAVKPQPEAKSEPAAKPEPEAKSEPAAKPEPEAKSEPKAKSEPNSGGDD